MPGLSGSQGGGDGKYTDDGKTDGKAKPLAMRVSGQSTIPNALIFPVAV